MDGYKVVVYRLTPKEPDQHGYSREDYEQVYEQKVEKLDLVGLVATVNGLSPSYRVGS